MNYSKKNSDVDLRYKSKLFFSIGLMISLGLTLTAFEWKFKRGEGKIIGCGLGPFEDITPIPVTIIPPPLPPPKLVRPEKIVESEESEEPEPFVFDDPMDDAPPIIEIVEEIPEEPIDIICQFPETNASFNGGLKAYAKYLRKNLKYPNQARKVGIEGRVYVQFVINKKGEISEVKILKGIGGGCDEEAVRVIKKSPPWNPGKQRGVPVKQRMVVPIAFKLGS